MKKKAGPRAMTASSKNLSVFPVGCAISSRPMRATR